MKMQFQAVQRNFETKKWNFIETRNLLKQKPLAVDEISTWNIELKFLRKWDNNYFHQIAWSIVQYFKLQKLFTQIYKKSFRNTRHPDSDELWRHKDSSIIPIRI